MTKLLSDVYILKNILKAQEDVLNNIGNLCTSLQEELMEHEQQQQQQQQQLHQHTLTKPNYQQLPKNEKRVVRTVSHSQTAAPPPPPAQSSNASTQEPPISRSAAAAAATGISQQVTIAAIPPKSTPITKVSSVMTPSTVQQSMRNNDQHWAKRDGRGNSIDPLGNAVNLNGISEDFDLNIHGEFLNHVL